jgi:glycosyltransferase involved in cell wall biosynthesis
VNILQISDGNLPLPVGAGGGTEQYILTISKQLAGRGHRVVILDRKHSNMGPVLSHILNVQVIRLNIMKLNLTFLLRNKRLFPIIYKVRNVINMMLFGIAVKAWLSKNRHFDIIHVHSVFVGLMLLLPPFKIQKDLFYTQHGLSYLQEQKNPLLKLHRVLRIHVMRNAKVVIALNPSARLQFIYETGLPHRRIAFIPVGVDTACFMKNSGYSSPIKEKYQLTGRIILTVSRIAEEKGIEYLVRAANLLVNIHKFSDLLFVLVGPLEQFDTKVETSQYVSKVLSLIAEMRLKKHIRILGSIPRNDLMELFSACDVFVLPSLIENFPQALLEAMASGKPVVATKSPGTVILIRDGWNGCLVEPANESQLAERIKWVLENPSRAKEMGINGKNTIFEKFSSIKVAESLESLYNYNRN